MIPGRGRGCGTETHSWEVPEHRTVEYGPRRHSCCIVVFTIDEGSRLLDHLAAIRDVEAAGDVLVADGGSSDGSVDDHNLRPRGVNTLLVKTGPGRLGAQMRMAFAFALRRGYEGVVTMDGNGKDDPSAIPMFLEALDEGWDHLQGSRFIPGGRAIRTPWIRHLAIRMVHAPMLSRAAGFRYTDTTNGFRAYSRRLLTDPRVAPFRDVFRGYELHYYLAVRAAELGFRIREVPVTRTYPREGPVPTKIRPVRGNLEVLKALRDACRHRFDPPSTATETRDSS